MTQKGTHMRFNFPFQLQIIAALKWLPPCKLRSSVLHTCSPRKHTACIYVYTLISSRQALILFVKYAKHNFRWEQSRPAQQLTLFSALTTVLKRCEAKHISFPMHISDMFCYFSLHCWMLFYIQP